MFSKTLALAAIVYSSSPLVLGLATRRGENGHNRVTVHPNFPCDNNPIATIPFNDCTSVGSNWVAFDLPEGSKCQFYWYPNCGGQGPPVHEGPECFYFQSNPVSVRCERT